MLIQREANRNRGRRAKRLVKKLISLAEGGNVKAIEAIIARADDAAYRNPNALETGGVTLTLNIGDKEINQDTGAPEPQGGSERDPPSDP